MLFEDYVKTVILVRNEIENINKNQGFKYIRKNFNLHKEKLIMRRNVI